MDELQINEEFNLVKCLVPLVLDRSIKIGY